MNPTPWYNGLRVQFVVLLTLALFPLGAVAIYQTNRVAAQADENARLALLGVTGRAAKAEELLLERATGAARFFGTVAADYIQQPQLCQRVLSQFVAENDDYSFIGVLPKSGLMTCSSSGQTFDFSGWPDFQQTVAAQKPTVVVNTDAPLSGTSVFVVSEPFRVDGEFAGFISVSIPHAGLPETDDSLADLGLEELMTFNAEGAVLTARSDVRTAQDELPRDRALGALKTGVAKAFQGRNRLGERRTYTIVPIEGSPATVLGVWRTSDGLASDTAALIRPAVFPVLMWLASMGVAMLSIYLLVLRPLQALRRGMDAFTANRVVPEPDALLQLPNEIWTLRRHFDRMTQNILKDEAELEHAVREKGVLVKEIHHRVKNNLQLISSIMNMQIRSARSDETKSVIASIQERVRSLASIHKDLYQSQNEGRVDAGNLVSGIIDNTFDLGVSSEYDIDLDARIDAVLLYPDQAVPLSLLVAEAATNIMKYVGAPEGETPWVKASLTQDGDMCLLVLANSTGGGASPDSTGLGSELIDAFAIQLGAEIEASEDANTYRLDVTFKVADFVPEPRDF